MAIFAGSPKSYLFVFKEFVFLKILA